MQDTRTGEMKEISSERFEQLMKINNQNLPVFQTGEILVIRGGKFMVKEIGKRFLKLESLPSDG